ncbi:MAG: hypothetical protein AVDCRST_MAG77-1488 [uncultured Chloroflexi bacterium]|uniref:Uncharacterized protein n=1 Tax=uncultured Chloroflexota bacterium TaxID=166587 RepID=A0A6J4I0E6_9CHLR|nr:MAG: hypothetical protein AVDCRST_MAG77-1488 [uncultured Chloroflexota bacterium]
MMIVRQKTTHHLVSAGQRRRLFWRADGELHPCQHCYERIYFHRRSKTWRDDDGRKHTHPPLPAEWH